ncbi:unnamed protein product [Anisakis simplex]|uniref:VWFA domain-containing protein n=1 Tax=Anisakis simplex TaxID=6269 RepID=A0A0M3J4A1_ANISI|nr:unnamed protein product [Anisakis simplex]
MSGKILRDYSAVRRDFEWTNSPEIQRTFRENMKRDSSIRSQFIGTSSGLTRLFPLQKWAIEPEPITIDLFDPRFRPWYISAISAPKDVLFLIDMSGSVKGQTVHLIRMTVLHILATLGPDDYINAIWFNSRRESLLRGCAEGFIPATTRNKKLTKSAQVDCVLIRDHFLSVIVVAIACRKFSF